MPHYLVDVYSNKSNIILYNNINHYVWGKLLSKIIIENNFKSIDINFELFYNLSLLRDFVKLSIRNKYLNNSINKNDALSLLVEEAFLDDSHLSDSWFDIIYDYETEYFDLNQYKNIIFPLHQEYISYDSLDKIYSFLNTNDNKNIISIGSDNFRRLVRNIYKDNKLTSIIFLPELVNYSKYNLNTAGTGLFNNCVLTNSDFQLDSLGVIMNPFLNKNSEQFFYDVKCDGNKKLPLLTVTKFGKNDLIQFNADQVGINFTNSNKLKTKLLDIVND